MTQKEGSHDPAFHRFRSRTEGSRPGHRGAAGDRSQQRGPAWPSPAKIRDIRGQLRQLLLAGAAVAVLSGAVWYGWDYWTVGRFQVSTDDAYVKADNTTIAPKVSGYLVAVQVGDNERVKAGQVLARIDDRDFKVALDQAKADVAAAQATVASKQAQLEVQQSVIAAAKATIEVDTATKTFASQENKRYTDLASTGYGSVQNAQAAQSRNAGAEAAIQRDNANLVSALKQVDLIKAELAQAVAASARAAALQQPGRAQSRLHHHHRADRRRGRQPHAAHRPVRAGRHAIDVAGAGDRRLHHRELQGDPAHPRREGPDGRRRGRHVPRPGRARPCRQPRAGQRPGIRAAAARQRHRQLHQGGAAHPREDRARRRRADRAAAGHVRDPDHRDQGAQHDIATPAEAAPRTSKSAYSVAQR